jgi:hypothetical protein
MLGLPSLPTLDHALLPSGDQAGESEDDATVLIRDHFIDYFGGSR